MPKLTYQELKEYEKLGLIPVSKQTEAQKVRKKFLDDLQADKVQRPVATPEPEKSVLQDPAEYARIKNMGVAERELDYYNQYKALASKSNPTEADKKTMADLTGKIGAQKLPTLLKLSPPVAATPAPTGIAKALSSSQKVSSLPPVQQSSALSKEEEQRIIQATLQGMKARQQATTTPTAPNVSGMDDDALWDELDNLSKIKNLSPQQQAYKQAIETKLNSTPIPEKAKAISAQPSAQVSAQVSRSPSPVRQPATTTKATPMSQALATPEVKQAPVQKVPDKPVDPYEADKPQATKDLESKYPDYWKPIEGTGRVSEEEHKRLTDPNFKGNADKSLMFGNAAAREKDPHLRQENDDSYNASWKGMSPGQQDEYLRQIQDPARRHKRYLSGAKEYSEFPTVSADDAEKLRTSQYTADKTKANPLRYALEGFKEPEAYYHSMDTQTLGAQYTPQQRPAEFVPTKEQAANEAKYPWKEWNGVEPEIFTKAEREAPLKPDRDWRINPQGKDNEDTSKFPNDIQHSANVGRNLQAMTEGQKDEFFRQAQLISGLPFTNTTTKGVGTMIKLTPEQVASYRKGEQSDWFKVRKFKTAGTDKTPDDIKSYPDLNVATYTPQRRPEGFEDKPDAAAAKKAYPWTDYGVPITTTKTPMFDKNNPEGINFHAPTPPPAKVETPLAKELAKTQVPEVKPVVQTPPQKPVEPIKQPVVVPPTPEVKATTPSTELKSTLGALSTTNAPKPTLQAKVETPKQAEVKNIATALAPTVQKTEAPKITTPEVKPQVQATPQKVEPTPLSTVLKSAPTTAPQSTLQKLATPNTPTPTLQQKVEVPKVDTNAAALAFLKGENEKQKAGASQQEIAKALAQHNATERVRTMQDKENVPYTTPTKEPTPIVKPGGTLQQPLTKIPAGAARVGFNTTQGEVDVKKLEPFNPTSAPEPAVPIPAGQVRQEPYSFIKTGRADEAKRLSVREQKEAYAKRVAEEKERLRAQGTTVRELKSMGLFTGPAAPTKYELPKRRSGNPVIPVEPERKPFVYTGGPAVATPPSVPKGRVHLENETDRKRAAYANDMSRHLFNTTEGGMTTSSAPMHQYDNKIKALADMLSGEHKNEAILRGEGKEKMKPLELNNAAKKQIADNEGRQLFHGTEGYGKIFGKGEESVKDRLQRYKDELRWK